MPNYLIGLIASIVLLPLAASAAETNAPKNATSNSAAATGVVTALASPPDAELTADEKVEREQRRACKIAICAAFRSGKADGADVSCSVVKSWRKEQLEKLVSKLKVSWPYGAVRCTADVRLKRADLAKALSEPKAEAELESQNVVCSVVQDKGEPAQIKFDFKPKVSFENGKATKAKLNWGKLEAPTLIKSALWTATAADNTVNLLSGTLIEDINDFTGKKCDEVKSEWQLKSATPAITNP